MSTIPPTDQSSILRFIEDNWGLGRLGNGSSDAWAGSLNGMFNFASGYSNPAVLLDPNTGLVTASAPSTGTGASATKAVANPKNLFWPSLSVTLDGTKSVSADGKPLSYSWTATPNTPATQIIGANTATPTVYLLGGSGTYTFTLTVTDSTGATATDTATIDYLP
jgi:PKD domain